MTNTNEPSTENGDCIYRIGLTMAGAISAGAYTAGVFDYLISALSQWEKAKASPTEEQPNAKFQPQIVAISGASAGGMTAVLGTIALGRTLIPTNKKTTSGGDINCVLPELYSAWVEKVRMVSDIGPSFLSNEDVEGKVDNKVRSLLNASLLDQICESALRVPTPPPQVAPYAFLAEPLHVYVTLTNLDGVEYYISFANEKYRMLNHGDRKHFTITGIGKDCGAASAWAKSDPTRLPLSVAQLNQAGAASSGWQAMGQAALATGAFPIGLAARVLPADTADYMDRKWPLPTVNANPINPTWPDGWAQEGKQFHFVAVDGGAIDNEPFELARYAIKNDNADNARDAERADRS
ncbi:MAG: hypothetical protein WCK65_15380, partial [Rhodospirillaceae bacterium]